MCSIKNLFLYHAFYFNYYLDGVDGMNISDLEAKLKRSSAMIASNFNPDFRLRNAVSVPRQLSRTSDMVIVLINN